MSRGGVGIFLTLGGIALAVIGVAMVGGLTFIDLPIPDEGAGLTGGIFLMIGVTWAAVGLGLQAYYRSVANRNRAEADLFRTGTRATAEIVATEATATEINDNPQIVLRLKVRPPGDAEFEHSRRMVVPRSAVPLPGHLVEVAFDPLDRKRLALEADDRFSAPPARFIKTRPPDQPTTPAPASDDTWSSMWEGDGNGHLREIERLADLRDRGALTQEEFERQKGRWLGR